MEQGKRSAPAMLLFLSLLIFCLPPGGDSSPISCYNDHGDAVDWFYLYKLPKEHGGKSPHRGELYLLMEEGSEGWTNGTGTVNDTTAALGRTVGQLYSQGRVRVTVIHPFSIFLIMHVGFM
ncbi:Deoxyribonuclease-2-beta [Liparis tanakae]|uniref:Deoxyribonuclease-2-alpha n=1 Tax=Liparis tanakae TaxID=230148 RepID=A0A4Z2G2W9_9TELE|nr:Deoxyribonuclease-2-beta [Liparis tanakae]